MNLGLRYDIETPRHEAADTQSVFDPNAPNPGATLLDGSELPGALIFGGTAQDAAEPTLPVRAPTRKTCAAYRFCLLAGYPLRPV